MKQTKTMKRLLSLMLSVVMMLGLLPTAAFAAFGNDVSTLASAGQYSVTFVQDAFEKTNVEVHTVTGNNQLLNIDGATLDDMSLQFGESGSMDVNSISAGYGLLNITVGGTKYYLVQAT